MNKLLSILIVTITLSASASATAATAWQCGAVSGYGAWADSGVFRSKGSAKNEALNLCNAARSWDEPLCYINYCNLVTL